MKKFYSVPVYQLDYNKDTSCIKKDYSVFKNAMINGVVELATLIVYEEEGVFKELISEIEVPVMEERISLSTNGLESEYHYNLKGDYPVFFLVNRLDEANASYYYSEYMETSEEEIIKYKDFISKQYSDKKGNYKDNWYKQLESAFMDNLMYYGEIVEENGYSDEYKNSYQKVYQKEKV